MTSFTTIPVDDIIEFLQINNIQPTLNKSQNYLLAWNLLKSNTIHYAPSSISDYIIALNLYTSDVKLPQLKLSNILSVSNTELKDLTYQLTLPLVDKERIIRVLTYSNALIDDTSIIKEEPQLIENYDIDWRDTAISTKIDDYYVIIVPAGTILYKGVTVKYPDNIIKDDSDYYSTLNISMNYAFSGQAGYGQGEHGKVILGRLIKDIILFDVSKAENFHKLREKFKVETLDEYSKYKDADSKIFITMREKSDAFPKDKMIIQEKYQIDTDELLKNRIKDKIPLANKYQDVLNSAFTDGKARYSEPFSDKVFSRWFCKNLEFDGWGLKEMKNARGGERAGPWPNEIMICNPSETVERLTYEFRLYKKDENLDPLDPYGNYYVYLTKNGEIIKQFPVKKFFGQVFKSVFWRDHYKGEKNKISDKYLEYY